MVSVEYARALKFIFVITSSLIFGGCAVLDSVPEINPNPEQVTRISGSIVSYASVQVIASYQTYNPNCSVSVNWFEDYGVKGPQIFNIEVPVQQTGGAYEARVPVDGVQNGHCGWGPRAIGIALRVKGEPPIKIEERSETIGGVGWFWFSDGILETYSKKNNMQGPPTARMLCNLIEIKGVPGIQDSKSVGCLQDYTDLNVQNPFRIPNSERDIRINYVENNVVHRSKNKP